jgi:beta-glucosidase
MKLSLLSLSMLTGLAVCQNFTSNYTSPLPTTIIPTPTSATTLSGSTLANPAAFTTALTLDVEDLWNLFVGPVSTAAVNTTVSATPVPTNELIPPPGLYYSSFSSGQQIPLMSKNESWKFPAGFWWGVASAAFQVEGAVKAEGRGPSIWDALLHRVEGYTVANQTGDITDNQYYLYKQGEFGEIYRDFSH